MSIGLEQTEYIRNYREQRIGEIHRGSISFPNNEDLKQVAKTVLHIIPLSITNPRHNYFDLSKLDSDYHEKEPPLPIHRPLPDKEVTQQAYNTEGIITYHLDASIYQISAYTHVFHNGTIEAVGTGKECGLIGIEGNVPVILGSHVEGRINNAIKRYLKALDDLEVKPPCFIMLSFIDIAEYKVTTDIHPNPRSQPIKVQDLLIPEILLGNFDEFTTKLMKPVFNVLWNASGWPGNPVA